MSPERRDPQAPTPEGPRETDLDGPDSTPIRPADRDTRRPSRPPRQQVSRPARTSQPAAPSDSPAEVARAVAAILDGGPTAEERELPWSLLEVRRIRSAARRILEAGLPAEAENVLLGALAKRAAHAELAEWCLDAIVAEIRGPEDLETIDHTYVRAQERMRRAAFEACPACLSRVVSEPELTLLRSREKRSELVAELWERGAP